MVRKFKSPAVPFVATMDTDSIQKIVIKGHVPRSCTRFSVYLQHGNENEPEEIAFVFDARFNFGGQHNKIVTNHKKKAWGKEEIGNAFPFQLEEPFKLKIVVDDDAYKVAVNGQHVLDFSHKLAMKTINCVRIQNDIVLDEVELQ